MHGTFTNSAAQSTPVLFYINQQLELKDEAENVTINGGGQNRIAITELTLSLLTQNVTESMLNSATRTGGVIIISENSNASIYNIMLNAIHNIDSVEIDD